MGSLANLTHLSVSWNELSGEIPPELGSLSNREVLDLPANQLSGCVPSSLQYSLDLSVSRFGGLPFC